jgi:hypothetical protein
MLPPAFLDAELISERARLPHQLADAAAQRQAADRRG